MSYSSITYYTLVVLSVCLYYVFPKKFRWIILLFANLCFYCLVISDKLQLAVFACSIIISYFCAQIIYKMQKRGEQLYRIRIILLSGIGVSIIPMAICRFIEFYSNLRDSMPIINLIIPVGVSFYSMQIVAYMIDVYRENIIPQNNFFKYVLFVSFFPLIIQGPISRYEQLAEQLYEGHSFDSEKIMRGIQLVIWGFFLKFLIADKAAVFVNEVFDNHIAYSGMYILIAGCLYSIQLYTDFLACVTMSQGVGEMVGIRIADNFSRPYFAISIKDFWRRWHISLSTWLRDYIYIPLGGSRRGKKRKYLNLFITFGISGLWHGGSIKYLVWGWLHATYQIAGDMGRERKEHIYSHLSMGKGTKIRKFFDCIITFYLVMLAWIIFRADSLESGILMIISMFSVFNPWIIFDNSIYNLGLSQKEFIVLFFAIIVLLVVSVLQEKGIKIRKWFSKQNLLFKWLIYLCAIWSIWVFGTYGYGFDTSDFIYGGF